MFRQLLLLFSTGVWAYGVDVAGKELEISDSSWASYQWAEPWHGNWKSHIIQPEDDIYTQDLHSEDVYTRELPHKQLQKRLFFHYIPSKDPPGLERPRQRHFDDDDEEPLYAVWEQPPLLAKEGITSEEAAWVPQGQPLRLIKQSYSWGSKEFDQNFGRHPPLVETHLNYEPQYPPSSHPPPPPLPSSPPSPPSSPLPPTSSSPTLVEKPYTPKTHKPTHKVTRVHPVPPYHPPRSLQYHTVPRHPDIPRKYFLSGEAPERHKNPYGVRQYFLNTEPTKAIPGSQEEFAEVPVIADNEIDNPEDFTDAPIHVTQYPVVHTSSITSAEEEKLVSMFENTDRDPNSHEDKGSFKHAKKHSSHPTNSPPYGYKLHPRPHPASHSPHYPPPPPPPYGHYIHQRPHYPTRHPYHPTPATVRKYFLSSSANDPHSHTKSKEDNIPNTTLTADERSHSEKLRMPRSTMSISWQDTSR